MSDQISVIIPTLNEENYLAPTIKSILGQPYLEEIIVVDGGSKDRTVELAKSFPSVRVLAVEKGRAIQMNAGAGLAGGDILLFVHADTLLPGGAFEEVVEQMRNEEVTAGSFFIRFQERHVLLDGIAMLTNINFPLSTFGDQGLWVRREAFFEVGGYPEVPILEDVEIQYSLRRLGVFKKLEIPIYTSARRFMRNGIMYQIWLDACILIGYILGVPLDVLAKWYR